MLIVVVVVVNKLHIRKTIEYVCFCVWLLAVNIMLVKFLHGVVEQFSPAHCSVVSHCMNTPRLIHPLTVSRYLDSFHFGVNMDIAAMNILLHFW